MRLIDADEFIEHLRKTAETNNDKYSELEKGLLFLVEAYTAFKEVEAVPVIHAKLLNAYPYGECSECGYLIDIRDGFNYCPNCGARLDEE